MQGKTFVIVVTFNSEKWITKCLSSISNYDVIIMDNCSMDNTLNIIHEKFPECQLITNDKNIGFAEANNIGIKKAMSQGAEYVFLLNHDAWIEPNTISNLRSISEKNPEYGVLSPIHLNGNGDLLDWGFVNYISASYDSGRKLYSDLLKKKTIQDVYSVDFVNAAAWLVTRECIEKVGLFDFELLPHYGEDDNYLQRVKYYRYKIGVVPKVFIYHDREDRSGKRTKSKFDALTEYKSFIVNGANLFNNKAEDQMKNEIRVNFRQVIKQLLILKFKSALLNYKVYKTKKQFLITVKLHRKDYLKSGFNL